MGFGNIELLATVKVSVGMQAMVVLRVSLLVLCVCFVSAQSDQKPKKLTRAKVLGVSSGLIKPDFKRFQGVKPIPPPADKVSFDMLDAQTTRRNEGNASMLEQKALPEN